MTKKKTQDDWMKKLVENYKVPKHKEKEPLLTEAQMQKIKNARK